MKPDPQEVVKAARANGEPQLAEWLQREVDEHNADIRKGYLMMFAIGSLQLTLIGLLIWFAFQR